MGRTADGIRGRTTRFWFLGRWREKKQKKKKGELPVTDVLQQQQHRGAPASETWAAVAFCIIQLIHEQNHSYIPSMYRSMPWNSVLPVEMR